MLVEQHADENIVERRVTFDRHVDEIVAVTDREIHRSRLLGQNEALQWIEYLTRDKMIVEWKCQLASDVP